MYFLLNCQKNIQTWKNLICKAAIVKSNEINSITIFCISLSFSLPLPLSPSLSLFLSLPPSLSLPLSLSLSLTGEEGVCAPALSACACSKCSSFSQSVCVMIILINCSTCIAVYKKVASTLVQYLQLQPMALHSSGGALHYKCNKTKYQTRVEVADSDKHTSLQYCVAH